MAWSTPRTWVANEKVSASIMNTHVRDQMSWIAAAGITAWEDFTATWTGTTNPTYTLNHARYCQVGKLVVARYKFTYTSGGTGTWVWSLPVTAKASVTLLTYGSGRIYDDSGTDSYVVAMIRNSTTAVKAWHDAGASGYDVAQTVPFTWASSDVVSFVLTYEAA